MEIQTDSNHSLDPSILYANHETVSGVDMGAIECQMQWGERVLENSLIIFHTRINTHRALFLAGRFPES